MMMKTAIPRSTCLFLLLFLGCGKGVLAIQRPRLVLRSIAHQSALHTPTRTAVGLRGGAGATEWIGKAYSTGIVLQGCAELADSCSSDKGDPNLPVLQKAKGCTLLSIGLTTLLFSVTDMSNFMATAVSLIPRYLYMLGLIFVDRQKVSARMERLSPAYVLCTIWVLAIVKNEDLRLNPFQLSAQTGASIIGYQLLFAGAGLFLTTDLQGKLLNLNAKEDKAIANALGEQGILDFTDGVIKLALVLGQSSAPPSAAKSVGLACISWFVMQCINTKVLKRRPGGSATMVHTQLILSLVGGLYLILATPKGIE